MRIKLKHNDEAVDAFIDIDSGALINAEYTDSGIQLDELEVLELELEYSDVINEYLNP